MSLHVFANWVIQLFLDYGNEVIIQKIINGLAGRFKFLSFNIYGCRVVQKALNIKRFDKSVILHELHGKIVECIQNPNAYHVIQHVLNVCPIRLILFVIQECAPYVVILSKHCYGYQIIKKNFEKI